MDYEDYVREIEEFKQKYHFTATETLSLQIAASLKFNKLDYDEILKNLIERRKKE